MTDQSAYATLGVIAMKKSTTLQRSRFYGAVLGIAAFVMVAGPTAQVFADSYDEQIRQIQSEVGGYQAEASRLSAQADTLQNALGTLTAQKNTIQAQLNLTQAKLDKLNADIEINERKLGQQRKTINKTVAQIYANGSTSPIEMVAGSKNIGDYVSSQAVRGSVQDQLKKAMDQVKKLKAQLQAQQKDVENTLGDQKSQRDTLAAKESEQANLLAATQGQESAYQGLIGQKNSQIDSLRSQQRAANAALGGRVVAGDPNGGGYPNNLRGPKDSTVDPWGMYNRECVSYTAWKVYQKNGYMPYWGGRGNANQWPSSARADGIATGSTPRVGSVAISMSGAYGHAMWVEQVNGSQIYVSQMNYDLAGSYSEMWVNGSNFIYLYF